MICKVSLLLQRAQCRNMSTGITRVGVVGLVRFLEVVLIFLLRYSLDFLSWFPPAK